jgi:hypothetical protein
MDELQREQNCLLPSLSFSLLPLPLLLLPLLFSLSVAVTPIPLPSIHVILVSFNIQHLLALTAKKPFFFRCFLVSWYSDNTIPGSIYFFDVVAFLLSSSPSFIFLTGLALSYWTTHLCHPWNTVERLHTACVISYLMGLVIIFDPSLNFEGFLNGRWTYFCFCWSCRRYNRIDILFGIVARILARFFRLLPPFSFLS